MSGHNKWSKIKHKKAKTDAKKGHTFTKIIRELLVAVKQQGADSAKVGLIVAKAKAANMPNEHIIRTIKKGSEAGEGEGWEEVVYEGYGPGGVALLIDALTDNRNRTIAELRNAMGKHGGSMATSGSVLWQFKTIGQLSFDATSTTEDQLIEALIDAGAEDIDASDEETYFVTCEPNDLSRVKDAAEGAGLQPASVELTRIASNLVAVEPGKVGKVMRLLDILEELDDVQAVYSNMDLPDDYATEEA